MGQEQSPQVPQDPLRQEAIQRVRDELKAKDPNFKDELDKLPESVDKLNILLTMRQIFWTEPSTDPAVVLERVRNEYQSSTLSKFSLIVVFNLTQTPYSVHAKFLCKFHSFGVQYIMFK